MDADQTLLSDVVAIQQVTESQLYFLFDQGEHFAQECPVSGLVPLLGSLKQFL